jgi:hypothetical protein
VAGSVPGLLPLTPLDSMPPLRISPCGFSVPMQNADLRCGSPGACSHPLPCHLTSRAARFSACSPAGLVHAAFPSARCSLAPFLLPALLPSALLSPARRPSPLLPSTQVLSDT